MNKFWVILLLLMGFFNPLVSISQVVDTNSFFNVANDTSISIDSTSSIPDIDSLSENPANEIKLEFYKKNKNEFSNTYTLLGFILLFVIIFFVRLASPEYFRDLILFAINGNYLLANYHKRNNILLINNVLLDIVYIGALTALLFNLFSVNNTYHFEDILLGFTVFVVTQIILVFIGYNTYFSASVFNIHLTNLLVFNRVMGIILSPAIFITTYLNDNYQDTALTFLLFVVVSIVIFRIFRVYFLIKKSYHFNTIYIILYLCVFEISLYLLFIREFSWFINLKL